MGFCRNCIHFTTEHIDDEPGSPCAATYGALGDSSFLELGAVGEPCECPGYEPEPIWELT